MKKPFLTILCGILSYLNLAVADSINNPSNANKPDKYNITMDTDKFYETTCDKLISFNEYKISEFPNTFFTSNKAIYHTISKCNLNEFSQNILAIYSIANCVTSELFKTDKECNEFAVKIGEKLKNNNLNFTLLDEFYKSNFKTLQREYFIDLLQKTNDYEILKFYLDNGVTVNENSRVLSDINAQILIFISQNCDTTKEATKLKQPTRQILEFLKTEKYKNFRDKQLKIANEILKHKKLKEFKFSPSSTFDDLFAITNDESYKIYQ